MAFVVGVGCVRAPDIRYTIYLILKRKVSEEL